MAIVAQLVRASDCGPEGRGFDSRQSPQFDLGVWDLGFIFSVYLEKRKLTYLVGCFLFCKDCLDFLRGLGIRDFAYNNR